MMRIDKFLWHVRIFKTRTLASTACNSEKVKINTFAVKPSKELRIGDEITLKEPPIWRSFKVLEFPKSRVGAKLVSRYIEETTEESLLSELKIANLARAANRSLGETGRPTKRQRRDLDNFNNQ